MKWLTDAQSQLRDEYADFGKLVAAIDEEMACLAPLVQRYLALHKNIRLCGGPFDEPITLNLRIDEWPKQYKLCQEYFGNRILAMDIRWVEGKV